MSRKTKTPKGKKNQDLALRNQWVDKLLREVVGRKVMTVLNQMFENNLNGIKQSIS